MRQPDADLARRILKVQLILGLVLAVSALSFGVPIAISVLFGAGICLLANALLAALVFRGYRAQAVESLVLGIYGAEVAKIVLILALLGLAFAAYDELNVPALLGAYFVVQVIPTLIAARMGSRIT